MYAFPQLIAVPALTSVGAITIEWPTIGAFFAWMLIAALVGSALGALRRGASQPPVVTHPRTAKPTVFALQARVDADHKHLEAA